MCRHVSTIIPIIRSCGIVVEQAKSQYLMIDWVIFAFELGTNSTTIVLTHFMCKNSWVQFQKLGIFGEIGYKETQRQDNVVAAATKKLKKRM